MARNRHSSAQRNPAWSDDLDPVEAPEIIGDFLRSEIELTRDELRQLAPYWSPPPSSRELRLADGEPRWLLTVGRETYVVDEDSEGGRWAMNARDWLERHLDRAEDLVEVDNLEGFWAEPPPPLYHATPAKNKRSILRQGLRPQSETRSLSNRFVDAAVFTSFNPDILEAYGDTVFEIDTAAMQRDGYHPPVAREEGVLAYEAQEALVSAVGLADEVTIDDYGWEGLDPETVVVFGAIPAKYLRLVGRLQQNPEQAEAKVPVDRPDAELPAELTAAEVAQVLTEQPGNRQQPRTADYFLEHWVVSPRFVLQPVYLLSVARWPHVKGSSSTSGPIIVDYNEHGYWRPQDESGPYGTPPDVIVLDGNHRHAEAQARGEDKIWAYVGEQAQRYVDDYARRWGEVEEARTRYLEPARTSVARDLDYLRRHLTSDQVEALRVERRRRVAALRQAENPREYWGSAGAGVLPRARSTRRFLVPLRSDHVMEPGTFGTIGGKLDFDEWSGELEEPEQAARREFEEETGQDAEALGLELVPLFTFEDEETGFTYHNFLGLVEDEFEPETNWETDEWHWVTWTELKRLSPQHFGLRALLRDRRARERLERRP